MKTLIGLGLGFGVFVLPLGFRVYGVVTIGFESFRFSEYSALPP